MLTVPCANEHSTKSLIYGKLIKMNKVLLILCFILVSKIGFTETLGQKAYPNDPVSQKIVDEQDWGLEQ